MRRLFVITALLAFGCDGQDPVETPDPPCEAEEVTLEMESGDTYVCGDGFAARLTLDNGSCETVTVDPLRLTAEITDGENCAPAAPATYDPMFTRVPAKTRRVVLDLSNTNKFCCTPGACPDPFVCEERFTFTVPTSAGTFTSSVTATLRLSGCGEICP